MRPVETPNRTRRPHRDGRVSWSVKGPARPATLTYRDGSTRTEPMSADDHVALWVEVVHAGHEGLVEFVSAVRREDGGLRMHPRDDQRNYPRCRQPARLVGLARAARARGEEAFATPLARSAPVPGKKAALPGRVLWVDVDDVRDGLEPEWIETLRPHLWVASGGGLHAYWRLDRELPVEEIESCNRRLAAQVKGDLSCTDRGRIMRLPGTINHKRGKWCRIAGMDLTRPTVDPDRLRAKLQDPAPPRPPRRTMRRIVGRGYDELALIPPPAYFAALAHADVDSSGGYLHCPLPDHDDQTASCHVWADAERGWWCFGCSRGGGIYDLASVMEGGPSGSSLRGSAFGRARARAQSRFR